MEVNLVENEFGKVALGPANDSALSQELKTIRAASDFVAILRAKTSPCCGAAIGIEETGTKIVPFCRACGEKGPAFEKK